MRIATAIMAPVKTMSKKMLVKAKNAMPAVQQVKTVLKMVYSNVAPPRTRVAMLRDSWCRTVNCRTTLLVSKDILARWLNRLTQAKEPVITTAEQKAMK